MFVLILFAFLSVSCTTASSSSDESYSVAIKNAHNAKNPGRFTGPPKNINFPKFANNMETVANNIAPTMKKTAVETRQLEEKENNAKPTGVSGIDYFLEYINDFLSEYVECLAQVNLMINCFNDIKLTYGNVNEAVIPNGILNAVVQALDAIVVQENVMVKQLRSVRTVAEGLVQNANINVLGINILPIAVTTVSQNFASMGECNYAIAKELKKIVWYNKFWSAELKQAKFTNDNSILIMITQMIGSLAASVQSIGTTLTNLSTEFVESVVDNRLCLKTFYPELTSMMNTTSNELTDIAKDMTYAGTALKLILTPENGANVDTVLPIIAAKMMPQVKEEKQN